MTGATVRESPYVGLEPFSEADADFFFGRDRETRLIIANLRSSRMTLFYGASGVGKSSVLRAGVMRELRERQDVAARRRGPGDAARLVPFSVALFSAWRDGPPLAGLMEAVRLATERATRGQLDAWTTATSPIETLRSWTAGVGSLLVVLDQFEEYFLYCPDEDLDDEYAFGGALPKILEDPSLPVNFVVALREDAWAKLDRFKGRIPELFANYLRLRHLDAASARRAIEGPIEAYNAIAPADRGPAVTLEPRLVDAVLDEIAQMSPDGDADSVETPFLQLVMDRLWDETAARGLRELRAETLDDLGGAESIVRAHLERSLTHLDPASHAIVADIFRFLVTPSRGKIALRASDLAHFTDRPEGDIRRVLGRIAGTRRARVLRPLPPAPGESEERYELFHDVLAEPILDWRRRHLQARRQEQRERELEVEEQERLDAARREHAARFNRLVRWSAGGLVVLAAGLAVAVAVAVRASHRATSRALSTVSAQQLELDPELGVVLARMAWEASPLPVAEQALRNAVATSRSRGRIPTDAGNREHDFVASPDGRLAAVADGPRLRLWDAHAGRWLDERELEPGGPISVVVWSADGSTVAAAGRRRAMLRRVGRDPRPVTVAAAGVISALALSDDGGRIALATGRTATVHDAHSGEREATLRHPVAVTDVTFAPHAADVVATSTCADGNVRLWRWQRGVTQRLRRRADRTTHPPLPGSRLPCAIAFSPDGRWLVTAMRTAEPRIWSARSGGFERTVQEFDGAIEQLSFSPVDDLLVVQTVLNKLYLLPESSTGRPPQELELPGSPDPVRGGSRAGDASLAVMAVSPDGRWLATGMDGGLVMIASIRRATVEQELRGHTRGVVGLGFLADGRLASAAEDGEVRLWDATIARDLLPVADVERSAVYRLATDERGQRLAFGLLDGRVLLADRDGGSVRTVDLGDDYPAAIHLAGGRLVVVARTQGAVAGRVVEADARSGAILRDTPVDGLLDARLTDDAASVLATDARGLVVLRDLDGGAVRRFDVPGRGAVVSATLSPDGRRVLAGRSDGQIRVFDVRRRRKPSSFRLDRGGLRGTVWAPDGRTFAAFGEDRLVHVIDADAGSERAVLRGHSNVVLTAAFSADSRRIATGGTDGSVRVWDAVDGRPLMVQHVHAGTVDDDGNVNDVVFDPTDAATVLTAGNDATARQVRCTTCGSIDAVLRRARFADARVLTAAERRDLLD